MERAARPRNSSVPSYRPIQSERALAHDQSQLVPGSGEGQPPGPRGDAASDMSSSGNGCPIKPQGSQASGPAARTRSRPQRETAQRMGSA